MPTNKIGIHWQKKCSRNTFSFSNTSYTGFNSFQSDVKKLLNKFTGDVCLYSISILRLTLTKRPPLQTLKRLLRDQRTRFTLMFNENRKYKPLRFIERRLFMLNVLFIVRFEITTFFSKLLPDVPLQSLCEYIYKYLYTFAFSFCRFYSANPVVAVLNVF